MQHPGKAAIAGVPNQQELKSRRGRPLSRIRDEQLQGANDSRGEVLSRNKQHTIL